MLHHQTGFTLIEIMVTLAVAIIVLAVATPNYIDFTRANKLSANVNNFVQALHLARNEAVRTGGATLCASNDQLTCSADGDWLTGWIIFADYNTNGIVEEGEDIVRVGDAFPQGFAITADDTKAVFNRMGFLSPAGTTLSFSFCSGRVGTGMGRTININTTGRPATVNFDGCV